MDLKDYRIRLNKIFVLWLLSLLLVGYVSLSFSSFHPEMNDSGNPVFQRWDSNWYVSIAERGYFFNETKNSSIAFFPLYPILMKAVGFALGIRANWAGFFLNIILSFFLVNRLFKLLILDYPVRESFYIVLFFLFFPASFFLISIYTETLFILLTIISFYSARKEKWFWAGIFSALAAVTRLYGVFLMPILFIEYFLINGKNLKVFFEKRSWLFLLFPFFSFGGFLAFNYFKFGNYFAFLAAQKTWGRVPTWPWHTFLGYLNAIIYGNLLSVDNFHFLINLLALVYILFSFLLMLKKARITYSLLPIFFILPIFFSGTFTSVYRYLLSAFPIFIGAFFIFSKSRNSALIYLTFSFIFLITLASFFVRWFPNF